MTTDRRLEQRLPDLLADLYMGPMPAYRDHVLEATARTPQRAPWSFVGRWAPFLGDHRWSRATPQVSWRSIGLAVVLAALTLALIALLIAGSRPRLPDPFGLARTGLVAYESEGDIYTVDLETGASTPVVTGPETDLEPRWSLDGARLAFERRMTGTDDAGLVFVAYADGSAMVQITPEPLNAITGYAFSPTGAEVLVNAVVAGVPTILFAASDGSGIRQLDVDIGRFRRPATQGAWRPPDGSEVLFMEGGDPSVGLGGIRAAPSAAGPVRTIVEPTAGRHRDLAEWSPDGARVAYMEWTDAEIITSRIHVISADGTGDRVLPMPPSAVWEVFRGWSNDGTRLLAIRGYTGDWAGSVAVVRLADGTDVGLEIDEAAIRDGNCCSTWEWAPDDSVILGVPADNAGAPREQVRIDPVTGVVTAVPWSTSSLPSWQRLPD